MQNKKEIVGTCDENKGENQVSTYDEESQYSDHKSTANIKMNYTDTCKNSPILYKHKLKFPEILTGKC